MTMTRKDYRAIADEIRWSNYGLASISSDPERRQIRAHAVATVARAVSDALKRDNPRFRYDTFYEACGLDENGNPPTE